jgi:multiple sugar transport system permease protein
MFYATLVLVSIPVLFVFYWMIVTSLKGQTSVTAYPPEFLFHPTLDNYRKVLRDTPFPSFLLNSVVVGAGATGLASRWACQPPTRSPSSSSAAWPSSCSSRAWPRGSATSSRGSCCSAGSGWSTRTWP